MLIAALALGALAAYYFGLRTGGYVAVTTFVLSAAALLVPRLATAIHVAIALGAVAIWQIGSRRPRPPDSVLAVRYLRELVRRAWSQLGKRDRRE